LPDPRPVTGWAYSVAAAVLLLDQLSKQAASRWLEYAQPREVFSWFSLTLHHNSGAAFSFLSGAGGWQRWFFALLALAVSALLLAWLRRLQGAQWLLALGLALVLGGAVGNLVDRLWLGHVVDFVSVHYRGWYFPTFNVADAGISVGAALVVLDSLFGVNRIPGDDAAQDNTVENPAETAAETAAERRQRRRAAHCGAVPRGRGRSGSDAG
jgi:signal peptidase II